MNYRSIFTKLILFCLIPLTLSANDRQTLQYLDRLMAEFKICMGDVFYPQVYNKLQSDLNSLQYRQADLPAVSSSITLDDIQAELHKWTDIAKQTQKAMVDVIAARASAIQFGAEKVSMKTFLSGEEMLWNAADDYYTQRTLSGKSAQQARQLYQSAAREAIRNHLIGEVRILLHECETLDAPTLAPQTYARTRKLLGEVESLVKLNKTPFVRLATTSEELQKQSTQLMLLVETIKPLLNSPLKIEDFVLELHRYFRGVGESLQTPTRDESSFIDLYMELKTAAENLKAENSQLLQRNTDLTVENSNLELALTSYRTIASKRESIQRKIDHLQTMAMGKIERRNGFITISMDSIQFDDVYTEITSQNARQLNRLLKALYEFSDYPVIVRYVQYATDNIFLDQQLATLRAEAIRDYLQTRDTSPMRHFQALGLVFKSPASNNPGNSNLEILIDIDGYLSQIQSTQPSVE